MELYDDVLSEENFHTLTDTVLHNKNIFGWEWDDDVAYPDDIICEDLNNYQLSHTFFFLGPNCDPIYKSPHFNLIIPLIKFQPLKLDYPLRIKANLNVRTEKIIRHGFHIDNPMSNSKTAIFYLNDSDGYTEFEESGEKVQSKANRLCVFPTPMRHSGTTCTNTKRRVVININYIPKKTK